jgi:integrase
MRRRHQTAVLYQRGKVPKWIIKFYEDRDGKRVRRTVTLGLVSDLSYRQALKLAASYYHAVNNAIPPVPKAGVTVADAVATWRSTNSNLQKDSSFRAVESHLRFHILPKLGHVVIATADTMRVQEFVNEIARTGVARKTVVNILQTLTNLLADAKQFVRSDLVIIGKPPKEPAILSLRAMRFILTFASEPYATMFTVLATIACRAGEMLGLKLEDLDFEHNVIHIRRTLDSRTKKTTTTKTKASNADVPMPQPLARRIREFLASVNYRPNEDHYLFVNRNLTPYSLGKVTEYGLWPVQDKCGIKRTGLHAFRHGVASEMLDGGVPLSVVQRQLRHAHAATTLRYTHPVDGALRRAAERHCRQFEGQLESTSRNGVKSIVK